MSRHDVNINRTPVQQRALDARVALLDKKETKSVAYNHSVLCQTSLPYRNPGESIRIWSQANRLTTLQLEAGYTVSPKDGRSLVPIGLPYGPRARLVLIHIMTKAVITQCRQVELDDSLTAFARSLGLATQGRNIRTLRKQMQRLAACSIRMTIPSNGYTDIVQAPLIDSLRIFTPKEPGQRVLWPSYVQLSEGFYNSLRSHAVPLDPRALSALKHSCAALDCYQWFAQRLHRVPSRGQNVSWRALHAQLGGKTKNIRAWRQSFLGTSQRKGTLPQVLFVYPQAQSAVRVTEDGLELKNAPPPISKFGKTQQLRFNRSQR